MLSGIIVTVLSLSILVISFLKEVFDFNKDVSK